MSERLIWISLPKPRATFGLVVRDGVVVDAAPIAKYAIGWRESRAVGYFRSRGATVIARWV